MVVKETATECGRVEQQMEELKDDVSVKSVSAYSQLYMHSVCVCMCVCVCVCVCVCECVYSCVSSLPINNR